MSEITSSSIGHISDVLSSQQLSDQPKKQNNRRRNNGSNGNSKNGSSKGKINCFKIFILFCNPKIDLFPTDNNNRQPKPKSIQRPSEPVTKPEESDSEDDENAKHCFICTDKITIGAIFPCNHVTCHKCTLRIRGLMKNKHCTQCRTDRDNVIFSRNLDKQYQDFTPDDIVFTHTGLGMSFDNRDTQDKVLRLLKFNCPKKGCGAVSNNWKELKTHVHDAHHLRFCNLCTRHKHQLIIEFPLYNARELSKHEREGDSHGFSGHPRCNFCNVRYYSDDELFEHLKMQHEKCHICSRVNPSKPQYFNDYNSLEHHFREAHYACMVQSCIDLKFVVFADEIDFKAHMVEAHPGLYGNVKTARSLNVDFQSQLSTVDSRPANSGNNNNNKQKTKPRPETSGTSPEASSSLNSQSSAFPALGGAKRSQFSSLSPSFGQKNTAAAAPSESPTEVARRRLDERVRNATNYDAGKFAQFTDLLALFTDTKIDAAKLVAEIKRLIPALAAADVLEAVIGDLVKIYANRQAKAHALKKVLEEVHLKSQFPTLGQKSAFGGLPTASGAWVSNSSAGHVGGLSSGQSREAAFPSLPSRTPTPSSAGSKGKRVTTTKTVSASAPVSRNSSVNFSTLSGNSLRGATVASRASPSSSSINLTYANNSQAKSSSSTKLSFDEFPSLPVAKPTRILSPMQLKPREVDVDDGLTILRPARDDSSSLEGNNGSSKKGKGRKKELLFHFG